VFTGLVREVGQVKAIGSRGAVTLLDLSAPRTIDALGIGDSLAVNGICLTVTRRFGERVEVEATPETRRVTTLSRWRVGQRVHLEPSLRVGDQLGGHFVLGHVDGVGRVASIERRGGTASMRVSLEEALAGELVPKGSIAIDGVSLTLDEGPFRGSFAVTLVPHTLASTRFGTISRGALVNLELDVLAKAARTSEEFAFRSARRLERAPGLGSTGRPLTLASILASGWQTRSAR
jgi:riboflavin synthase